MFGFLTKHSQSRAKNKIGKEISERIGKIATQIAKGKRNEEETRRWCVDILKTGFGYKDTEIETELSVLGKRVDIALMDGERVIAVVECKAATVAINSAAINQAANYAVALSAEWAIVTNGHQWKMFYVVPHKGREPDAFYIFEIDILDEDGLSKDDIGALYLMTKKAILSGEAKMEWYLTEAKSLDSMREVLLEEHFLTMLAARLEQRYQEKKGIAVKISPNHIQDNINLIFDVMDGLEV